MDSKKKSAIMKSATFDDLLDAEYGKIGTSERAKYEDDAQTFILAECLKDERKKTGLTQEQLAQRLGTKKSYISKLENGLSKFQNSVGINAQNRM